MTQQLIAAKIVANRRECYIKGLAGYLARFIEGREETPIADFTTADVETWLKQFPSPYSRQTWLARISLLFSYAVRHDFICKNPCARIERMTLDRKAPLILSVADCRLLLKSCPSTCLPYLILAMFAGVRPGGELMKLQWEHINLETGTVEINFPKVRKQRRIVQLESIAVALLKQCRLKSGPVAPSSSTVRRWKRKARFALGLTRWPQDILRHTAASYMIALHNDAAFVARQLGNSTNILLTHYVVPVTMESCKSFWNYE